MGGIPKLIRTRFRNEADLRSKRVRILTSLNDLGTLQTISIDGFEFEAKVRWAIAIRGSKPRKRDH